MNSTEESYLCDIAAVPDRRWYMIAILGVTLSIFSLIFNLLIAKVLLSSRHSHFYFLGLLAVSDCFLSVMYGPVIAMDIIKDRIQNLWVTTAYLWYLGPLLSLCHVSMTFSTYLIILATIERYLITQKSRSLTAFRRNRKFFAFFMFVLSLLLRGTSIFEIEIKKNEGCVGLTEYAPGLSTVVETWWYGTVFRFYIRNILTVFLPFILLAWLNYRIVLTLRRQQRCAEMFRFLTNDHKAATTPRKQLQTKIRSATCLLVAIVCSYLVANVLNVIITAWEYINLEMTQTPEIWPIYEFCTDIISVLYIFVCATRLLVYFTINKEIREAIIQEFKKKPLVMDKQVSLPRSLPSNGSGKQMGTEIDAVAIAIARRLMSIDIKMVDPNDRREDSPVQAIIYANQFGKCAEFL